MHIKNYRSVNYFFSYVHHSKSICLPHAKNKKIDFFKHENIYLWLPYDRDSFTGNMIYLDEWLSPLGLSDLLCFAILSRLICRMRIGKKCDVDNWQEEGGERAQEKKCHTIRIYFVIKYLPNLSFLTFSKSNTINEICQSI